jgi:hypothetical protein
MNSAAPSAILVASFLFLAASGASALGPALAFRVEAAAQGSLAATKAPDTELLSQPGYGAEIGAALEYRSITVIRLGFGLFRVAPSAIASDGQLYRGWDGERFSAMAGYSWNIGWARLGLLAGAALSAANYLGTPLVFAYPSAIAEPRLDFRRGAGAGFWIGLPVELVFRGSLLTPSAALALGLRWTSASGARR